MIPIYKSTVGWPCEYCKKKFPDVQSVIQHELYLCLENPKFKLTSENLEKKKISKQSK